MSVYLNLFHGRISPKTRLDDWGFNGPVLGPLSSVHITYGFHIKFDFVQPTNYHGLGESFPKNLDELFVDKDGLVLLFKAYYGDYSIFSQESLDKDPETLKHWKETFKVLSMPVGQLPTLLREKSEWVRRYAADVLKNDSIKSSREIKTRTVSSLYRMFEGRRDR
jgi:hypothetical protein